jgi:signal transduction histidine kinase/tetratricopeptide (TPR) repeat protein
LSGGPSKILNGRYTVGEVLREHLGVSTHLGQDGGGAAVVVKTIPTLTLPRGVRERLEDEAEILIHLDGLDPIPLLAWGRSDGRLHLVMPRVPGEPLDAVLARGAVPLRGAITVGRCVLETLVAAHGRGALHHNIKPSNVIVTPAAGPIERAVLVDFGLSPVDLIEPPERQVAVEAIRYVSPEQAGLLRGPVDGRSDLYSVGLLLFECLSGRPPYAGDQVGEVLLQHLNAGPPRLRGMGIDIPRPLEELVLHLLQKEPRDRYQTAAAALEDLRAIERELHQGEPSVVIGRCDRRESLTAPNFVGRQEELQRLQQALVRARLGEGVLTVLEGEPGAGKTVVLQELARRAAAAGMWALQGEATDDPGLLPHNLLEGVVGDVIERAQVDPSFSGRLRGEVGELVPALVRALPRLQDIWNVEPGADPNEAQSLHAVARFIAALGTRERAAVLLLDDAQWADEAVLRCLAEWQRRPRPQHVAVVVAHRPDEARLASHALDHAARVELPPLSDREVHQLLESMAGPLPPDALEAVTRLVGGNPFMAAATLWGMVETETLVSDEAGWRLVPGRLTGIQSSRRVVAVLTPRLEQLDRSARRLLRAAAVLGIEFALESLSEVAGVSPDRTTELLEEARRRHLLWTEIPGSKWRFTHQLLRESLLEQLDPGELRRLHLAAARHIERYGGRERPFQLAHHYDAAGEHERSRTHALEAAELARARHALDVAERYYRIAARDTSTTDVATRRRVATGLGEVLLARNQHGEAKEQLELALSLCEDDRSRARLHGRLGLLSYRQGVNDAASEAFERGLELAGQRVPRGRWPLLFELGRELGERWLRGPGGGRLPLGEEEQLALALHTHLPFVLWHHRGLVPALWSHLRRLNLAERVPGSPELGYAYAFHSRLLGGLSLFRRAERYIERSRAICDGLEDPWGRGYILFLGGTVHYAGGRLEAAEAELVPAIELLERAGDPWQALNGRLILGCVHLRKGELARAVALGRGAYEEALRRDQALPASGGLDVWAKASGGDVPAGLVRAELKRAGDDLLRRSMVSQAEALRLLRQGEPDRAAVLLEQIWIETGRAHLRREHVFPIPGWLLTAWRLWAASLPCKAAKRREICGKARRLMWRARLMVRLYPNHRPHVLRECGLLAALGGVDCEAARELLDRSITASREQGARYELAQSLVARGRLRRVLGGAGALEELREGERMLRSIGADFALGERIVQQPEPRPLAQPSLSLADRFDQLLGAGRRIVTSLSDRAALESARDAAMKLIRCQHCLVIEVTGELQSGLSGGRGQAGPRVVLGGDDRVVVSSTLVRHAMELGEPAVASSGVPDPGPGEVTESDSIMLSGVRSALAAPIPQRDEPRYCLYMTHVKVGGLFGEEERRLAAFIGSLAGAALENAQYYGELELAFSDLKSTQAQLVQAAKLAALGQLGAGIAHELNQPIQSIQGFAQRILRNGEARVNEHHDELEIIVNATHRMARIVQNIRQFARDSSLERRPIDPTVPLLDALMLLRRQLERMGIEVVHDFHDDLPTVTGDPVKLQQVFLNLILNARDALAAVPESAPRRLVVSGFVDGDRVVLTVEDSGPGVAAGDEEHIFDPFFTTKEAGEGTGLGLSISYGIIKEHGGELQYRGGVGGGALFSVTLPREVR